MAANRGCFLDEMIGSIFGNYNQTFKEVRDLCPRNTTYRGIIRDKIGQKMFKIVVEMWPLNVLLSAMSERVPAVHPEIRARENGQTFARNQNHDLPAAT